ncbi:MAG: xanthine dehydrogenase family protein subunit M [Planctomycetota bacterium]|nr:xanthine dehydrogenase family protein subunit M [Planctomycetota bacterium]
MKEFDYLAPESVSEVVSVISEHGDRAKLLAGGTDIIVQLREGLREADVVVDIKKIDEVTSFKYSEEHGLSLGAAVACYQLYEHPKLSKLYGALADSTHIIGGWQIQSRASVGGNLCNASPAADSIPSLIALNATAVIAGPNGERTVAVQEFCTGPGRNVLENGELLVSIQVPAQCSNSGSAYERFIPRNEMDIAVVGVGSWVRLSEDGTIAEARISLGAVAATPLFAEEASASLAGIHPTEENFAAAGELAKQIATPISDMRGTDEYRAHLVGVLVKRTLTTAAERAQN